MNISVHTLFSGPGISAIDYDHNALSRQEERIMIEEMLIIELRARSVEKGKVSSKPAGVDMCKYTFLISTYQVWPSTSRGRRHVFSLRRKYMKPLSSDYLPADG